MSTEPGNAGWSADTLLPAFQAPEHLDVYDLLNTSYDLRKSDELQKWRDIQLTVTTMVGVINRQQPKVYLLGNDPAMFWLNEIFARVPHDVSSAKDEGILDAMLNSYGSYIRGLIIYDPNFMDSINIATMLAGQRDGIVVSPALAEVFQGPPHQLPVIADLRIYQWRSRIQAYSWAESNLLKDASPKLVAGLNPTNPGALRSFLVATRTFIYWLDASNSLPDISSGFVSERGLMQRILKAFPPGTIHLGWFINEPWGVRLTSKAAIPVLASDLFFNLEVWTSMQNVQGGEQGKVKVEDMAGASPVSPITTPTTIERQTGMPKAYVSFTFSDGDNLQYNQNRMSQLWQDAARGTIPIGWTISPVLVRAAPAMAAYYLRTATPNDELVAGPSGAAYILPSNWPAEQVPAFLQFTGELIQAMNLSVVEVLDSRDILADLALWISRMNLSISEVLDVSLWSSQAFANQRLQQNYVEALAPFGMRGVLSGNGLKGSSWRNVSGVPVLQNLGLADTVDKAVNLVRNASAQFLNVYIFAWRMTPSDIKQVIQQLGDGYEVVTPGKLLQMIPGGFN